MTSKIVVNNIEADAGVSTVTFNSNVERGTSNLHSVGLEAAGINVLGADTPIGSGSTIYDDGGARFSGIVTATSFSGDGSQLSGISVDSTKIETGNTKVETIDTGSDGHIKITTEGSERLRINAGGDMNLGSGATVAGLRYLDVQNSSSAANNHGSIFRLITSNAAGNSTTSVDMVKYKDGNFYINNNETSGSTNFNTGGSTRLTISSNGDTAHNGQKHTFRFDNSGGIGPYLSLQNRVTATGTACGIAFGCGNSDASMTTSDYGEGQIKVYTDSGPHGNMEFNLHTGANRSYIKIVGNGQGETGAGAGAEGMRGGVAFGCAGVAIDRSWTGQPGIHVFNENVEGDTDQGTFRFHGWNRSYTSYPGASGSDFGVNVTGDGSGFSSDERKKTGIATITNALNTVAQLRGVSYKFVNSELKPQTHMTMDSGTKLGFVAQEVIPLLPSIVIDAGGEKAVPHENGWCDRYCIDYGSVTPLLAEAIKELKAKNEALEARVAALEGS